MKKIFSVILTAAFILCSLSVAASAMEYSHEIKFGETLTLTVGEGEELIIKFSPEISSKYIFRTESEAVDTGAYLSCENGDILDYEYYDDTEEGTDFCLSCYFEAGEEYYLNVFAYSFNAETFDLVIDCGHSFEDGACVVCGKTCDHSEFEFLGYCLCGEIFMGKDIKDGDKIKLESKSDYDIFWFRFTPEKSGTYSFKSISEECDPDCVVYNADGEWITDNFDVDGLDFNLIYFFEAGETYYFDVHNCFGEGSFEVEINRLIHTVDDGSEHDLVFVEGTFPNCSTIGYTDGLYCEICKKFISGHEELPIDKYFHIDDDYDKNCDICGKENIYAEDECNHICHSENPFLMFIWKIANFIHSVFGISPECECGEYHHHTIIIIG